MSRSHAKTEKKEKERQRNYQIGETKRKKGSLITDVQWAVKSKGDTGYHADVINRGAY